MNPKLKAGDIIYVNRLNGFFQHYGVYVGNNKVVHYSGDPVMLGTDGEVKEVSLEQFLGDTQQYCVKDYSLEYEGSVEIASPELTIKRAYSKLGETDYDLFNNNCEHFAAWCKTGVPMCSQIKEVDDQLSMLFAELDEATEELSEQLNEAVDAIFA